MCSKERVTAAFSNYLGVPIAFSPSSHVVASFIQGYELLIYN